MLRLVDVGHRFDATPVLAAVSLTVATGEIVCLLGPSGCGKTTLLRLAAGLERLQQGRIEIAGEVVADAPLRRHRPPEVRRVGLMFQDFALFPHLTVTQNIRFGTPGGDATDAWIRRAIGRAGLAAWADAYPHTLSGGQQQRCALLRALAPQPRVLLLDEPFSGLDVTLRAQVRDETADFLRETGIATLVVTHDAEEAMGLADRLVVMRDGGIVQAGRPAEIYLAPADPFVAGLFGPLNRWAGPVTDGHVDTPLGRCPAPGLAAGQPALVLVRPEQIQVSCPPAAANATVVASRLLGGVSRITIETDAGGWRLDARAAGVTLPAAGERVVVGFDPSRAFVFPAAAGDGRRTGGECTQSLSG